MYNEFFDIYTEIMQKYRSGKHKGIKWVLTIDSTNVEIVKKFLEMGIQVRHSPTVPPMNFAVSDEKLNATVEEMKDGRAVASLFASDDPLYVNHFRAIFTKVWETGIPAKEVIEEITRGLNPYNTVLFNPAEIQNQYRSIIKKAQQEVLALLPTPLSLTREEKIGVTKSLVDAAARGAAVKILTNIDERNQQIVERLRAANVEIRQIRSWNQKAMIKLVVVDKSESLAMEIKDGFSESFEKAVKLATVTNHYPTVLANNAVFENLWEHVELYQKLEQETKMKEEFINIAAHELRTPVVPIMLSAEVLLDGVSKDQKNVEAILRNANRLNKLSQDILDASRFSGNYFTLKKELIDIKQLVRNAILDNYPDMLQYSGKRLVLEIEPGDKLEANVDPSRIKQALTNLLDNAVKFTEQGTVAIRVGKEADNAIVSVIDTGTGIDPSIKDRLFGRFVTRSEKKTGIGLGLFICKGIIEAHGGTINGRNNENGKGATFTFTLPLGANSKAV